MTHQKCIQILLVFFVDFKYAVNHVFFFFLMTFKHVSAALEVSLATFHFEPILK